MSGTTDASLELTSRWRGGGKVLVLGKAFNHENRLHVKFHCLLRFYRRGSRSGVDGGGGREFGDP